MSTDERDQPYKPPQQRHLSDAAAAILIALAVLVGTVLGAIFSVLGPVPQKPPARTFPRYSLSGPGGDRGIQFVYCVDQDTGDVYVILGNRKPRMIGNMDAARRTVELRRERFERQEEAAWQKLVEQVEREKAAGEEKAEEQRMEELVKQKLKEHQDQEKEK